MTNSMHRQGSVRSLEHDFILFTHAATGYNKKGSAPRHQAFARIVLKHRPVNFGIGKFDFRRSNFLRELFRARRQGEMFGPGGQPTEETYRYWESRIAQITDDDAAFAVFDEAENFKAAVMELKAADLGISIDATGLHDEIDRVLRECGIVRHSIEHSLGFRGNLRRLPEQPVLELSTMCGHGMVSFNLARKMMDMVKLGQLTPERAAQYLAKGCTCSIYNPRRACEILEDVAKARTAT